MLVEAQARAKIISQQMESLVSLATTIRSCLYHLKKLQVGDYAGEVQNDK